MKIRRVEWARFRVPFVSPFTAAHGTLTHREGVVVQVTIDNGTTGIGEVSPLPSLGGGSVDEAERQVATTADRLVGRDLAAARVEIERLAADPTARSVQCAFDTALVDLRSRLLGVSAADLLMAPCDVVEPSGAPSTPRSAESASRPSPRREEATGEVCSRLDRFAHASRGIAPTAVEVNATIGAASISEAATAAAQAVERGFRCIKLKVGIAATGRVEIDRVAAVRQAIGTACRLRLDANGAWSEADAIAILRDLERYDVELIEQPVAAADLAGMARVRAAVPIPVAADEAVSGVNEARRVVAADAADILVVKPMHVGGLLPGKAIAHLAAEAHRRAFVTTTIDTGIGIAAAAHLAATLEAPRLACGLATADLLVDDLIREPIVIRGGELLLPAGPGLGVSIDHEAIARFSSGWKAVGG